MHENAKFSPRRGGGRTPGTPYAGSTTVNNCNLTSSTSKFKMTIIVLSGGRVKMHFVWCYRYSRGRVSSFTCSTCPVCCILFGVYSYSSGMRPICYMLYLSSLLYFIWCYRCCCCRAPQCYLLYLSSLLYFVRCYRYCRGRVSSVTCSTCPVCCIFGVLGIAAAVFPICYLLYLSSLLYFVLYLQVLPRPCVHSVTCSTCRLCCILFCVYRYCRGRVSTVLPVLLVDSAVFCFVFTGVAAAVCPICYMLYLSSLLGEGICMPICVPGALIALRTRIRAENKIKVANTFIQFLK